MNKRNVESIVKSRLTNYQCAYKSCGYDKEGKISAGDPYPCPTADEEVRDACCFVYPIHR